ncbi:DUF2798 domain-containing protein [Streptococcus ratti]|uniref:DUF2798 domain-containing protein n=2 Tax=Streptococcus ratti TaxID=1341 RepID=UPI000F6E8B5B|nr:Uncharacterised protein [Streptococcus mutans]
MHFWLSLFNGAIVTSVMMYKNTGSLVLIPLLISIFQAFVASFVVGLIIPAVPFGAYLASEYFTCKSGTFKYILISSIPVCLLMATLLSFLFAFLAIGIRPILLLAWLSGIPIAFIISMVTTVCLTPLASKLSTLLSK